MPYMNVSARRSATSTAGLISRRAWALDGFCLDAQRPRVRPGQR